MILTTALKTILKAQADFAEAVFRWALDGSGATDDGLLKALKRFDKDVKRALTNA